MRTDSSISFLQRQAASLLLYQSVLKGEIGQAFLALLHALQTDQAIESLGLDSLSAYGVWFRAMATTGLSWQAYLIRQILNTDNPFTHHAQRSPFEAIPPNLIKAAQHDLQALQILVCENGQTLSQWVQTATNADTAPIVWEPDHETQSRFPSNEPIDGGVTFTTLQDLPIWKAFQTSETWGDLVSDLAAHYRQFGSGKFAEYWAFRWQFGSLVGIAYPDPIQLTELTGYDLQKQTLIQNTEALLAGYPALHVLLYGSRGSGKSSLVKALLQTYGRKGLRLIEVNKAELKDLPAIVDSLRSLPQKFIIFVDDLSFEEDDDAYKALKVVLEGNITARPPNMVVYATSNRRHLIREFFSDRPRPSDADEIHTWDTVQEKLSFSDRFGITLTFEPANQETYLAIVHHLAQLAQIELDLQDLEARALQWATRHNGRSGRSARQFVDFLCAERRSELEKDK
jgi:predicted AAA+ superfamily ATPase